MDLLQRRIDGDWYDIRHLPLQFFAVHERLPLPAATLAALTADLGGAAGEGIVACKRVLLGPVFFALEELRYQSLTAAQLADHGMAARRALFFILLQRVVLSRPERHVPAEALAWTDELL